MTLEGPSLHDLIGRAEVLRGAAKRSTQERHVAASDGSGQAALAPLIQSPEGVALVEHLVDGLDAFIEHAGQRLAEITKEARRAT